MLLESIHIPSKEFQEFGLKDVKMRRLGRLVALAGKNGAGKTRLLKVMHEVIGLRWYARSGIEALLKEKEGYDRGTRNTLFSDWSGGWGGVSEKLRRAFLAVTEWAVSSEDVFFSLNFVPKKLDLADPRKELRGEVANRADVATSSGADDFHTISLFYLHHVLELWFSATHQDSRRDSDERLKIETSFERLQVLMHRMLGEKLERGLHGDPMLFGKAIADARLSEGQKVLLQLCVALHAQGANLDNTVLLLDEPENHLHPSAVIEVLDALYAATTTSQIWIATHSVPLLAYMTSIDPMCLWYVSGGGVEHAVRRPEVV
ncbi:AAA family ATPase, partial [Pseudomonas viridiflava]|uniref:AAA family ATPase n=1 Tax=Pseudomonas viridiflava TaxID=33069 RepID=UPI0013E0169D